jgi:uronate dehydrogenase
MRFQEQPILLTGAAGGLGRVLRPRLIERYGRLRSSDIVDPAPALAGEELVVGNLADADFVDRLVAGCGAIIHFGGRSIEDTFQVILQSNIVGTFHLFDAAKRAGIKRIVFASSNHAIGFHRRDQRLDARVPQRPDTLYGVSKAFGEDLASLYVDKYGLEIACVRIGTCLPEPVDARQLSTWLSHDDLFRLMVACLEAPKLGFAVMYGASNNSRGWWDNSTVPEIDYRPQDNAEIYAAKLLPGGDKRDPEDPAVKFQGGVFVTQEIRR